MPHFRFRLEPNMCWTSPVKQTIVLEDKKRGATRRQREKKIAEQHYLCFFFPMFR